MVNAKSKINTFPLRRLAVLTGSIITGLLGLVIIGLFYLDSTSGHHRLTKFLNDSLQSPDGGTVISSLEGSLYSELIIPEVTLYDKDGIWLEVHNTKMNWSIMPLLFGVLDISDLRVDTVHFFRRPLPSVPVEEKEVEPFSMPNLPVDINVSNYTVDEINIDEALADLASQFKVDGHLLLTENEGIDAKLLFLSTAGHADTVTIELSYPSDESSLDVAFNLDAPKNGLIQSLANLQLEQSLSSKMVGSGPLDHWLGALNVKIGQEDILNSEFDRKGEVLKLNADFDLTHFVPDGVKEVLGNQNNISIMVEPEEESDYSMMTASLTTHTARLEADGIFSINSPDENDKINLKFAIDDANNLNTFIAPSYVEPFIITGTVSNILSDPQVSLSFTDLVSGVTETIEAALTGQINSTIGKEFITVNTSGQIRNLSGPALASILPLTDPGVDWSMDATIDQGQSRIELTQLSLNNMFVMLAANANINDTTGEIEGHATAAAENIQKVAAALKLDQALSGALQVDLDVSKTGSEGLLEAILNITTSDLDLGEQTLNEFVGAHPEFIAKVSQAVDGAIVLSDAKLSSSIATFTANVSLDANQVIDDGNFKLSLANFENMTSLQNASLSGDIDIVGTILGDAKSPSINVETGFESLSVQNFAMQDFSARLKVDNAFSNLAGVLNIDGITTYGALDAHAEFGKAGDILNISNLKVALGNYFANGTFEIPPSAPILGEMTILTREIEDNNFDIEGEINANITLSNENNKQRFVFDSTLADIRLPIGENDLLTLESSQISVNFLESEGQSKLILNSQAVNLMHPLIQMQNMDMTIDQVEDGLMYNAQIQGTDNMAYNLNFEGGVQEDPALGQKISVGLSGTVKGEAIALEEPVQIILKDGTTSVPAFTLHLADGTVNGDFVRSDQKMAAHLVTENIEMGIAKTFYPSLPLTGLLSGSAELISTLETVDGGFDFKLSEPLFDAQNTLTQDNFTIALSGRLNSDTTTISGSISDEDSFKGDFSLGLPIEITPFSLISTVDNDAPLQGALKWTGDISTIWPVLQLIDHDVSGDLDANLVIGGTINTPDLDGQISLANGHYENMQSGFVADDIEMAATILDRRFTLDRFDANDGETGKINATADVNISPDMSYEAKVDLILSNAHLVRQPELQITASSNLTFEKSAAVTSLIGDITVENSTIGAVEQGGPSIANLDVTEINGEGIVASEDDKEDALGPIDLDLKLRVPNKLFIRSFGLDSEWKADLDVSGSSEEPIIKGKAELVRGFFEFSGKRFDLKKGDFSFPGDKTNDPVIEVSAEHQLNDMVAKLRVFGQASDPTLEMSSTPYLPENEVMARILFGTSVAQLTVVEAVQLASAVHSLSNGGGQGLMGGVRRAIGVDRLSIDNDNSREYGTTITGGKYLTDNVYVEVSTAPATGETATSVEVGLTRNLSLVTRRTLDHDNNLSIRWFWDY